MQNNPFRSTPTSNADDWGKTKFKPKNFGGGKDNFQKHAKRKYDGGKGNNFQKHGKNKYDASKGNNFHKNKGTYKFNEVANDAKPDNATKWSKFKDEIIYKQGEIEQAVLQANMDSSEAKKALKMREINYRKSLIQEKKLERTEWEDFSSEEGSKQNKVETSEKYVNHESGKSDIHKTKRKISKGYNNTEDNLKKQSKTKFNKTKPRSETKKFISKELLDNFDSKKLNYKQNDKLRSVITKTAIMASGGFSLESVVLDMKKKAMKKEMLNKERMQ